MGVTHDCLIDPVEGGVSEFEVSDAAIERALEQYEALCRERTQ